MLRFMLGLRRKIFEPSRLGQNDTLVGVNNTPVSLIL